MGGKGKEDSLGPKKKRESHPGPKEKRYLHVLQLFPQMAYRWRFVLFRFVALRQSFGISLIVLPGKKMSDSRSFGKLMHVKNGHATGQVRDACISTPRTTQAPMKACVEYAHPQTQKSAPLINCNKTQSVARYSTSLHVTRYIVWTSKSTSIESLWGTGTSKSTSIESHWGTTPCPRMCENKRNNERSGFITVVAENAFPARSCKRSSLYGANCVAVKSSPWHRSASRPRRGLCYSHTDTHHHQHQHHHNHKNNNELTFELVCLKLSGILWSLWVHSRRI